MEDNRVGGPFAYSDDIEKVPAEVGGLSDVIQFHDLPLFFACFRQSVEEFYGDGFVSAL